MNAPTGGSESLKKELYVTSLKDQRTSLMSPPLNTLVLTIYFLDLCLNFISNKLIKQVY